MRDAAADSERRIEEAISDLLSQLNGTEQYFTQNWIANVESGFAQDGSSRVCDVKGDGDCFYLCLMNLFNQLLVPPGVGKNEAASVSSARQRLQGYMAKAAASGRKAAQPATAQSPLSKISLVATRRVISAILKEVVAELDDPAMKTFRQEMESLRDLMFATLSVVRHSTEYANLGGDAELFNAVEERGTWSDLSDLCILGVSYKLCVNFRLWKISAKCGQVKPQRDFTEAFSYRSDLDLYFQSGTAVENNVFYFLDVNPFHFPESPIWNMFHIDEVHFLYNSHCPLSAPAAAADA